MLKRWQLHITGVVQGVGFRPFVYNLAQSLALAGWVCNNPEGVEIQVQGQERDLTQFIQALQAETPPLAKIETLKYAEILVEDATKFEIIQTKQANPAFVLVSPDICTCADCLQEMQNPQNHRYRYPFINCTNCGPRFTIIKDLPYDREKTTMDKFQMCPDCAQEYTNPANRRFHAQPNACPDCGPQLSLLDHDGKELASDDIISTTVELLKAGHILAIKGLGGYHLACDALNEAAVSNLRNRKIREEKPFAIMVKDVAEARKFCLVSEAEASLLASRQRPIVLLRREESVPIAKQVAPGNSHLGIMLPYTPLHYLLFEQGLLALVMTSGNLSSEPIVYKDEEALEQLKQVADYFLVHNRPIQRRVDDSVLRVFAQQPYPIRRSRGYAPEPIKLAQSVKEILAVGGEQKNTFCLSKENYAFMSHHIGDLENLETLNSFEAGIADFSRMFNLKPQIVAYDLHPEYLSTKFALDLPNITQVGVQHHHAHVASVMAEHGLTGPVIGVALDGTGYGLDGKLWGGEFFIGDYANFQRVAYLDYAVLPGGSKAIKEPWRMAASYLTATLGQEAAWQRLVNTYPNLKAADWQLMWQAAAAGINAPETSSMGRLFDGVAALLGVRAQVSYEGQAAIELEQWANEGGKQVNFQATKGLLDFEIKDASTQMIIDWRPLFRQIIALLDQGMAKPLIAWYFHQAVAEMITQVVCRIAKRTQVYSLCLSGGVFQNMILLKTVVLQLEASDFKVFYHQKVPTNDGGISLGQIMIANQRSDRTCV